MFIEAGEAQLFATAFGTGTRTILGIGGWIGSWELWQETFAPLSARWLTIAFDHRGTGATIAPVESITFDNLVDDVFRVMDAYQIERCVLAGESAGGGVALAAALKRPERISGLVIADGVYFTPPAAAPSPFRIGLEKAYEATIDRFVSACVPEPDGAAHRAWGRKILARSTQAAAIVLFDSREKVDLRADLPRIGQPTLIVHGEADAIVPVASSQMLAKALPNAKLVTIPGAGHVPTMTRPQVVADAIEAYFR